MRYIFIFICLCFFSEIVIAQEGQKPDSARVYRNIEKFSKKRKSTNFLYKLLFKPVEKEPETAIKKIAKRQVRKPYSYFEGKIIRNIYIVTLDPFGYDMDDTAAVPQNFLYKAGNTLHLKTLPITITNLLLFKENEPFDSLLVKESERLIRTQKYVYDVSFYPKLARKNSDSVDIYIRELDEWSIIPAASLSSSTLDLELTENNFLGTGHQLQGDFAWDHTNAKNAQKLNYFIPNVDNTYVNGAFMYNSDENKNVTRGIDIERPFFSPFAKWAAGLTLVDVNRRDSITLPDSLRTLQNFSSVTQDYWAGKSWRIFKGNSENERTTNLIVTGRYLHSHYNEKPSYDLLHVYDDENFYLGGIGISARRYVKDQYVFNYGVTEDVPVGKTYELFAGYDLSRNTGRTYLGIRISSGNYTTHGYLSTSFEYGTFIRASHPEQGAFNFNVNYFTDLFEIGRWKFRQFIKPQLTLGFNRFAGDTLNINDGPYGIKGFNGSGLTGTHKMLLTLQTQSYSPWNLLGFQFGPYFIFSVGMLGNENSGFRYSKMYSEIGVGVLIKNEFLVFSTFQVSVAFYPVIPGLGSNILKYNPAKTSDFGFRDFSISKPGTISYQ